MSITLQSIKPQLERLRLQGLMQTFESRLEQGRENGMSYLEVFTLLLQDEIERRDAESLKKRTIQAKFDNYNQTFETLVTKHYPIEFTQCINEFKSLHFMTQVKHIIIMGPTGTGKTHIAQSIGHQACRMKKTVFFSRAHALFQQINAAKADNTYPALMKKLCNVDLLIIDDFGLSSLNPMQAEDIYELVAIRAPHRPFIITSNRSVDAWVNLFPDPVMANAILDRLANVAYQILIDANVDSYRKQHRVDLKVTVEKKV